MERLVGIFDALHLMLRTVFRNQQGEGRHPLGFVQAMMCRALQYDAFISRRKLVGNDLQPVTQKDTLGQASIQRNLRPTGAQWI